MNRNRPIGKLAGKNLPRIKRKAQKLAEFKPTQPNLAQVLRELNEARTVKTTRRALAMVKLFSSAKTAASQRAKNWSSRGRKVLLHPLPPKASVMAASFVLLWAVVGLASAYGRWGTVEQQKVFTLSSQSVQSSASLSVFNPGQFFKNTAASFKKNANNQLAMLAAEVLALQPVEQRPGLTVAYYHLPAVLSQTQGEVLGAHASKPIAEKTALLKLLPSASSLGSGQGDMSLPDNSGTGQ